VFIGSHDGIQLSPPALANGVCIFLPGGVILSIPANTIQRTQVTNIFTYRLLLRRSFWLSALNDFNFIIFCSSDNSLHF
jgi:hypothetical protein